jgi:hypothetical protein
LFTVTEGKAKVGVALGPGVSVRLGVSVMVAVKLGTAVSDGGIVGVIVSVIVLVGKSASVAVIGIADGTFVGADWAGELQASETTTGMKKNKLDFRMSLFYNDCEFCIYFSM